MLLLPAAALGIKQAFSAYPPSSFEYPGTFEHVCIQRGLPPNDEVQLIFALPPDAEMPAKAARGQRGQRSNDIPLEVSLEHSLRSGSMPRSRQVATVKVVRSRSVYASINHILENASEVTDVRILGGTAFMMRTPCEYMADNYYNALTEEGPLLSRVLEAWRAADGQVAPSKTNWQTLPPAGFPEAFSAPQIMPQKIRHVESEQRTLLLTNRCRHKLYRDDLRDLLLGRHHAVQKLLPGSLVCTKRLELSLSRFFEQLKASAAAKALGELDNHGELPWARLSHATCAEGRLGELPAKVEQPKPLLVAVIQRTRNRRIININALIKKLRSSFAAAAAAPPPRHGLSPESDLVRSAVIEQVFFEDSSVMEQIRYMQRVDVLVGVTGSGLTNLAFMRPGSIVVELMSPLGRPNYFASLITRVHGALGRGVFTYKRVYFEPANGSHERSIYGTVSSSEGVATLQTRGNPGGQQEQQQLEVRPPDFDAVINASAVAATILGELRWREAGLDVEH